MTKNGINEICIFRELTEGGFFADLKDIFSAKNDGRSAAEGVAKINFLLSKHNPVKIPSLKSYVFDVLRINENPLSLCCMRGLNPDKKLISLAKNDFAIIMDFCGEIENEFVSVSKKDEGFTFEKLLASYESFGAGIFSKSVAYEWNSATKSLCPIESVSEISLLDLKEYQDEKKQLIDNTEAFLNGMPALNALLYGDRGTGKSSTVHALLNEYKNRGLRLIEIKKSDICDYPLIISLTKNLKFKFIVFIDDLSFSSENDDYSYLKAALEGSVRGRSSNVIIYATTNRRHIIRENHSDRHGDEVHASDTMEEKLSLSDRFGLVITFINPDKKEYLSILKQILAGSNISLSDAELELKAEQFALRKGGRSPRAASQLADLIRRQF